jgi:hypothetical protein
MLGALSEAMRGGCRLKNDHLDTTNTSDKKNLKPADSAGASGFFDKNLARKIRFGCQIAVGRISEFLFAENCISVSD